MCRQCQTAPNQTYSWQWIGSRCSFNGPARSSDLNRLDFWLWGHSNTVVYSELVNYLQQRVDNACLEMRIKRGILERNAVLCYRESKVVLIYMGITEGTCCRDTRKSTISQRHWFLDLCRLGLWCSFKWALYTLKPVTLSFNTLYKKLLAMSLNYLRRHFSRFTRTETCL